MRYMGTDRPRVFTLNTCRIQQCGAQADRRALLEIYPMQGVYRKQVPHFRLAN